MGQAWTVRNEQQMAQYMGFATNLLNKHGTVTFSWRKGGEVDSRSLGQNALFQKWSRQYAGHILNKDKVTDADHEAMKHTLQRHCYAQTGWGYLITEEVDLFTGKSKPARAHTSDFDPGEMHQFMNWVQARAADDGFILESLGEYLDLIEAGQT